MRSTSFFEPKIRPMRWCSAVGVTPSIAWRPVEQRPPACSITALSDTEARFAFAQAQWAITPGQSMVLYRAEVCLGGGVIEAAL